MCFSIIADCDPGLMPRIMELFAKRALVPHAWFSRADGRELSIDIQSRELDADLAQYFAACFRQFPGVRTVLTFRKS